MKSYLACLDKEKRNHYKCRELSKEYLQCRMDRDLMAKEDLDGLGFSKGSEIKYTPESAEGQKAAEGFIAGKHIEKPRKWFWQS
eukprot:CAMPEP_0116017846 /NCGR_PEP_ID=MMETSP0321-20121206/8298_1 /TAXON_ID=163516 /ORGANISM="Leptocylindrus danicus var. danicus, Strain B650" /LENGTH=83 /DNA_ID=CAMNT_0003488131 /DNA_START=156 /DNA_END=407 /DNA_ORIENTATION=-